MSAFIKSNIQFILANGASFIIGILTAQLISAYRRKQLFINALTQMSSKSNRRETSSVPYFLSTPVSITRVPSPEKTAKENYDSLVNYANNHSIRMHPVQQKLVELTMNHPQAVMMTPPEICQLLQNIIIAMQAKMVIQIGVFTGTTTLGMALAMAGDGKIVACEESERYTNIGVPYWKEAGMIKKIDLYVGPYIETLNAFIEMEVSSKFDLVYIDADKENYEIYYEKSLRLLRRGGIIALDGVLWYGSVLEENSERPGAAAVKKFNERLKIDRRVVLSMLVIGDGLTLAVKL